jgi:hypothetical protein
MSEKIDPEISPSVDGDSINRLTDEPGVKIPKQEEYDPWDLDAARNRQKKERRVRVVTTYRISNRPREGSFFRVNPDSAYQYRALLYLERNEKGIVDTTYLVDWRFQEELEDSDLARFFQPALLLLAIEWQSSKPYVHYIKEPRDDQRDNDYWVTARTVADKAMKEWVQCLSGEGGYDYNVARKKHPDPQWPNLSFGEILKSLSRDD